MSYSILYRSMFVKLSDGRFIPMMEMGDNNVYDASYRGKARRSRSWSNLNLNRGQKFFTHEEIVKALENWNNECEQKRDRDRHSEDEYDRNAAEKANFGYYEAISVYGKGGCFGTSFNDVKNIVLSGEKNCISFDDAIKKCGFRITYWEKSEGDNYFTSQKTKRFESEEEMFAFVSEKFGEDGSYYFVFNSNYETDKVYKTKKAIKNFTNGKGKKVKPFKVVCGKRDTENKFYLRLDEVGFSLTEDKNKATCFHKYVSGGVRLTDILFDEFDVKSVHYDYEKETEF